MKKVNASLHKLSDLIRHTSRSTRIVNAELADFSMKLLKHANDHNDLLPCFSVNDNNSNNNKMDSTNRRNNSMKNKHKKGGFPYWQKITNSLEYRVQLYEQYLNLKDFEISKHIVQDLPRTYGDKEPFKSALATYSNNIDDLKQNSPIHQSLCNVLHAYALHDPQVGYVQGMNLIVGFLLINSSNNKNNNNNNNKKSSFNEIQSFWIFSRLMKMPKYNLRSFFLPGMPRLMILSFQMDQIMSNGNNNHHVELFEHFKRLNIETKTWFATWALTLYSSTMPWNMLMKVWDYIFKEGLNLGIISIAISILQISKQRLLLCTDTNELLNLLKSNKIFNDVVIDVEMILKICKQNNEMNLITQNDLDRLEVEYFQQL